MRRPVRRFGSLALLIVLLPTLVTAAALAGSSAREATPGVTQTTILLGASASLTGPLGRCNQQVTATRAWIQKVNAGGGIYGRKLKWVVLDDGSDPARGVDNVRKLVEQYGVFALFGACGSPGIIPALPYVDQQQVPFLFMNSVSESLLRPKPHPTVFTMIPLFSQQAAALVPWAIKNRGPGTFAIVNLAGFDPGIVSAVKWATRTYGGRYLDTINVGVSDTDMNSVVIRLRNLDPDYVLISTTVPQLENLLVAMKNQRFKPKKGVLSTFAGADPAIFAAAGNAADGLLVASTTVDANDPRANVCKASFKGKVDPGLYSLIGCGAARALQAVLKQNGKALTRDTLLHTMTKLRNVNTGVSPQFSYRPGHMLARGIYIWEAVPGGKFKTLSKKLIYIPPDRLYIG